MALFTTGLIDNPPVAGVRPSATIDVLLTNDALVPIDVQISGFYVSGTTKIPYVLELFTLAPGVVATRNYFSQFDIFEFEPKFGDIFFQILIRQGFQGTNLNIVVLNQWIKSTNNL